MVKKVRMPYLVVLASDRELKRISRNADMIFKERSAVDVTNIAGPLPVMPLPQPVTDPMRGECTQR